MDPITGPLPVIEDIGHKTLWNTRSQGRSNYQHHGNRIFLLEDYAHLHKIIR